MVFAQNYNVINSHQTGQTVLNNNGTLMDSGGDPAHFVAGNEVFYGHIHCVFQKTRRSIWHPQFVVHIVNPKGDYFSVGVQNKRRKKI